MLSHLEHYQQCNCLDESSTCCRPQCPCQGELRAVDILEKYGEVAKYLLSTSAANEGPPTIYVSEIEWHRIHDWWVEQVQPCGWGGEFLVLGCRFKVAH